MSQTRIWIHSFSGTQFQDRQRVATIIHECTAAYRAAFEADPSGAAVSNLRGIRLADESAFVKFGSNLQFREAEIQNFVYMALSTSGRGHVRVPRVYAFILTNEFRYIVMELVNGSMCNEAHIPQVARALEELIMIKAPTKAPGPVKPGPIDHGIFDDNVSSITYSSVLALQTHFNAVLAKGGHIDTLDFVGEVQQYGLCLCPSDMDHTNFMIDLNGMIVALDFGQTSFLPPCFFHHAITVNKPFINLLARVVNHHKYPTVEENHLGALQKVGYLLVLGSNNYALPSHLMAQADYNHA